MLTVRQIESLISDAKATGKAIKRSDGGGMSIHAKPDGAASWLISFRLNGKQNTNSLGQYPQVSLKEAREKREEARRKIQQGISPASERRVERHAERSARANTFKSIAEDWLGRQGGTDGTKRRRRNRLEDFIYPDLGSKPIDQITARDLLDVLRKIETADKLHTMKRVHNLCSKVWHHAMIEGKATVDVPHALKDATFKQSVVVSHAGITDQKKFGQLLRDIDGYSSDLTRAALKLLAMIFVRPIELRKMEWSMLDLDGAIWNAPARIMKGRRDHMIPLSNQAVNILRKLEEAKTGDSPYVFPSQQTDKMMSENTMNKALRTLGYDHDTHVSHGFRTSASTILHELGEEAAIIELQLAHKTPGVAGIYNRAARLEDRVEMMQRWSNHLDKLKAATE